MSDSAPATAPKAMLAAALANLFPAWERRMDEADDPLEEAGRLALRLGGDAAPRVFLREETGGASGPRHWDFAAMRPYGRLPFSDIAAPLVGACWASESIERFSGGDIAFEWPGRVLLDGEPVCVVVSRRLGAALAIRWRWDAAFLDDAFPDRSEAAAHPVRLQAAATLLENFENPAPGTVILDAYRKRCATLRGGVAGLRSDGERIEGEPVGISLDGELMVRVEDGSRKALNPLRDRLA